MTGSADKSRNYALLLLRYRGRSEKELRDRLRRKGFSEEDTEKTFEYLRRAGFLNDRMLAENLKHQAISNRLMGFGGAKRFMRQRGLAREVIDEALEYDEQTELENIRKLMDKKLKTVEKYPEPKRTRSLMGFLMRKGYSLSVIRKAMKKSIYQYEETEE